MIEDIKVKINKSKEIHRYNITSSREWFENLLTYIINLQQENKQLKEELERSMKANIVLDNTNTDYASIIFDLEDFINDEIIKTNKSFVEYKDIEYLIKDINKARLTCYKKCLDKIQELKEKYK